MEKFSVKCKFCGNEDQDKIQTTMEDDDGYSEYTILESGYVEFKCGCCGTFGTDDYDRKDDSANKLDMFELTCDNCGSNKYTYESSRLEEDAYCSISCDDCGAEEKDREIDVVEKEGEQ